MCIEPEEITPENVVIPEYMENVPVVFDWCTYQGKTYFASWNYEESEKIQQPVFDLAYCATKAMNEVFLRRVVYSKRYGPRKTKKRN
jgi:hypothetical protein